ncbi:uncharacterized protein LOC131245220 isoform X2 [Magnolia sinica]|uniref:uncharacterized protein LOC131245220 isoform X2 n=1 Tax=Magnolia sinica TaxID=86752 RepID=UPI00265A7674|nr:uncharacterized protein LOC131245220 isoform X2 [Magnolia sinica]
MSPASKEMPGTSSSRTEENATTEIEYISSILPLELIKSQKIPPSPNRSDSSIDFLLDFSGFSWIAFGASSLLVISHFPSPLSHQETLTGPIFRQVIELPCGGSGPTIVNAVAWSPSRPSDGEIAAASENRICLYSADSGSANGSFCWRQIAGFLQSSTVEAIKWTGSGDGLIAAGIEVVLWKKKNKAWELAWKSRTELPQTLVSATWSIEGPSATAIHALLYSSDSHVEESSSLSREASKRVLVYHGDGKSGFVKVELCHPQPVSMIQWRPSTVAPTKKDDSHSWRDVLLTCCLDGTVRLWCEIDSGKARKSAKDITDQKTRRGSFHVAAIIEINQPLKGTLGMDTFITWAMEIRDTIGKTATQGSEYDMVGKCEWLIGVGPEASLIFWAIHCLDDISPLRFPRVTLWKKKGLLEFKSGHLCNTGKLNSRNQPMLLRAIISRNRLFGPPTTCSLLQLLPDNSISWSHLYSPALSNSGEGSSDKISNENTLSCFAEKVISQAGPTGNILQVAVHPYSCEVELAVSLDSNGFLLFWSLSTTSSCILSMPALVHPTWKPLGRIFTQDVSSVKYSTLKWAPSVFSEKQFLLMGHVGGIDFLIIKISESDGDKIIYHKICTIPFPTRTHESGPDHIFATSLSPTCCQNFISNSFMLFGIWMKDFQALSWKVVLHSDDLHGSSCQCGFDAGSVVTSEAWRYESTFDGRRYHVIAQPCSSKIPDPHNHDQVTAVAVVCPDNLIPSIQQKWASSSDLCSNTSLYNMATGCSDGSLKLWRIGHVVSSIPPSELASLSWELVGMFMAHQGPVSGISLSSCGSKIATISMGAPNSVSTLHIWESICLTGAGSFLLEDTVLLNEAVIAFDWLAVGNGQLLLGVCMRNELCVYAQKRLVGQIGVKSEKLSEMHIWFCIAFCHTSPAAQGFLWGPRSTLILVHDMYFSLFSQWSACTDTKHQPKFYPECTTNHPSHYVGDVNEDLLCAIYTDRDLCNMKESSVDVKCELRPPVNTNFKKYSGLCNFCLTLSRQQYEYGTKSGLHSMLEIGEKLRGALPIYHPEALFLYLHSGNWKRAYVAVQHLVEYLNSDETSATCSKDHSCGKSPLVIPQIQLSQYFGELSSTTACDKGLHWGGISSTVSQRSLFQLVDGNSVANAQSNVFVATSGKFEVTGFLRSLEKSHVTTAMTNTERTQILAMIDLLGEISDSLYASAYESFDEPGRRFWVAVRYQQLYILRKFGRLAAAEELIVDSGSIVWAFQSDCQDNLFSSFLSNEPSWIEMRNLGVGFWFTNVAQLRTRMEKLARVQYLKKKDPKDCALLYLALNRLQVLTGLFKISKDEKDRPLVGFLSRNFQEEKNKAAALKNAYVLMGKHQLELAIAFFLLGGDPSSAVTVCAKNHGDEQLALVICRLVEGYGGPLERHLISNFLLPTAIEKEDYWLASLLEWVLGNYSHSFQHLLGFEMDSTVDKLAIPSNRAALSDPSIGQYCVLLSAKNNMKNSVGECTAAMLARWATWMTASALNRCGLPLEALECLSSASSTLDSKDQDSLSDSGKLSTLNEILKPSMHEASSWLSGDVTWHLESRAKLNLAMQFVSKSIMEHPSWLSGAPACSYDAHQYELLLEKFEQMLNMGLAILEQKYSLESVDLMNMIIKFACNNGLLFLGYSMLHGYTSREHPHDEQHGYTSQLHLHDEQHASDSSMLCPPLPKLFLKASKEVSGLLVRYIVACSITRSALRPTLPVRNVFGEVRFGRFHPWDFYLQDVMCSMGSLRPLLKLYGSGFLTKDLTVKSFTVLDILEYCVCFASAWSQGNWKTLFLMIQPILIASRGGHSPSEIKLADLKRSLLQAAESMVHVTSSDSEGNIPASNSQQQQHTQSESVMLSIPEDEKWQLIGVCLWRHLSNLCNSHLNTLMADLGNSFSSSVPLCEGSSLQSSSANYQSDITSMLELIKLFPALLAKLIKDTVGYISSSLAKQLASFLGQKVEKGLPAPTLVLLEASSQSEQRPPHDCIKQGIDSLQINNENGAYFFEILWEICVDPKAIHESFIHEKLLFPSVGQKPSKGWLDIHKAITDEYENGDTIHTDQVRISSSAICEAGFHARTRSSDSSQGTGRKDSSLLTDVTSFRNPKEIYKKNGELLEAMCVNSINQQQAALASNRKGLIFFNLKVEPFRVPAEYIWSESDWPENGWAGSESTPIATFISPGIGLGSKKGAHLGLGGPTVGRGSLARPGKDLTGGGAFGIPGYAGVGASGFGWGEQEDFDDFVDPPATVENIKTRALSSHPSRPFFLVGSSNTHVYLWEFGKGRATATYGVLPAANVPPPYALASISALQFDRCGHRFATAALDGTLCTWQLEVGGRSNVHPTESSLCFNSYASDVGYVAASGSILATAGYSPNGVNLVIWDTLAPPATSQASVICHEGGARSLSVFDNDIGSGSISPLIVTGGKGGDIGLHDFRYIATGRTKRHRHLNEQNMRSSSAHNMQSGTSNKFGEQNRNGMLWHIPKAHQGSITKISTIPNTSLFLTGSKDGDVKLWDVRGSEVDLVFHWQNMHDRHTFLQPSSRGFGGVVRVAVTDIVVLSHGFLTCGGDGYVRMVQIKDA